LEITTIRQLAVNHPYYGTGSGGDFSATYNTFNQFIEVFKDCDIDLNYCYRFDIIEYDDGTYGMHVFIILQRKGKIIHSSIEGVTDEDVPAILEYLSKHYENVKKTWSPISDIAK
jgi:hypothetical protein